MPRTKAATHAPVDTPPAASAMGAPYVPSAAAPSAPAAFDLLNEPVVVDTLTDEQREQLGLAAIRELDDIATVQAVTRDASGKLADAYLVAQVLALRLYGHSPAVSAEIMGVPESRVTTLLQRVRRDADIDTQMRRLDDIAVPLAVDNIIRGVVQGDKEYTLEFARGRGLFKTHASVKQETQITEVKISIEAKLPAHLDGKPLPVMKAGAVVAAAAAPPPPPKMLDGEIVDADA